jgi:tetratricopeptide (TPR) repeat protein
MSLAVRADARRPRVVRPSPRPELRIGRAVGDFRMTAHRVIAFLVLAACAPSSPRRIEPAQPNAAQRPPPAGGLHGGFPEAMAEGAVLFDDLGTHHRDITTASPEAQRYFDQGLRLLYGFNHDEAARSFAKAAVIDRSCAMCYWGAAYALGPNYNMPMLPDRFATAWAALGKARTAAATATTVERALIDALASRYAGPEPHDQAAQHPLDVAYADAMRRVSKQFPDDADVQVLAAEAMMDLNPWRLWARNGTPAPGTLEIVARLEAVLARHPDHPGANHYYIHAVEASRDPGRALPMAARLPSLMPGAGHIVHMPAHIYQRVGRYADASAANRAAIAADLAYLRRVKPPGYYPMYVGHNHGFLASSESMLGRSAEALAAARAAAKAIPPEMLDMMPGMDLFTAEPLLVMVRFGMWADLLDEPRPPARYHALTGLWLHARGMALASTNQLEGALAALAELRALAAKVPADERASNNTTRAVLEIGVKALEARIAENERDPAALALWAEAVAKEDTLVYAEPADWFYPLRHYQGAALLAANRPQAAEQVYRADLAEHPHNGWALRGLVQALRAQHRARDADQVQRELDRAWSRADITPARSAY